MTVGQLEVALLRYPDARRIIVVVENREEHGDMPVLENAVSRWGIPNAYSIASVDEIRDEEMRMPVVILACTKIPENNDAASDTAPEV